MNETIGIPKESGHETQASQPENRPAPELIEGIKRRRDDRLATIEKFNEGIAGLRREFPPEYVALRVTEAREGLESAQGRVEYYKGTIRQAFEMKEDSDSEREKKRDKIVMEQDALARAEADVEHYQGTIDHYASNGPASRDAKIGEIERINASLQLEVEDLNAWLEKAEHAE